MWRDQHAASALQPPFLLTHTRPCCPFALLCTLHKHAALPASMAREVGSVFPDVDLAGMLVVPTCQQADHDLVRTGEKVDQEKDRLLERVRGRAHVQPAAASAAAAGGEQVPVCPRRRPRGGCTAAA
jgi:hypothetical protein